MQKGQLNQSLPTEEHLQVPNQDQGLMLHHPGTSSDGIWEHHMGPPYSEMVQRRSARFAMGDYHTTSSVSSMMTTLHWQTLQESLAQAKMTMMYRISDAQEYKDCSSTDINSDSDVGVPFSINRIHENCSSTDVNSDSDNDFIQRPNRNSLKRDTGYTEESGSLEMNPIDLTMNEDKSLHSKCENFSEDSGEKNQFSNSVKYSTFSSSYKVHDISDSSDEENIDLPSLSERLLNSRKGVTKLQEKNSGKLLHEKNVPSYARRDNISKRPTIADKDSEQFSYKKLDQISSHNVERIDLTEEEGENDCDTLTESSPTCIHYNKSASTKNKPYSYKVHDLSDSSDSENLGLPSLSERLGGSKERKKLKKSHGGITEGTSSEYSSQGTFYSESNFTCSIKPNVNSTDDLPELVDTVDMSDSCTSNQSDNTEVKKKRRTPEEIAESKKKAQMLKAEKDKIRQDTKAKKDLEKKTKAQVREIERERKKQFGSYKDSLQYLKLVLDTQVVNNCGLGASVFKMCESLGCKCVTEDLTVPYSILWRREVTDLQVTEMGVESQRSEKTEDEAVIVLPVELFVEMVNNHKQHQRNCSIEGDTLTEYVKKIQSYLPGIVLTLVVIGTEKYFRDQKTAKQRQHRDAVMATSNKETNTKKKGPKVSIQVTRVDIEQAVTDTQLMIDTMVYMLETPDEVAEFLRTHTKAVADKPAKAGRLDSAAFSFQEEKVSGIRVDKSGHGLLKVWKQQIMQFKNVSPDVADAIVAVYPSPRLLIKAYSECASQRDGERLLENIMVRRGAGVLETTRRVGKELSRRFYLFMNSRDPDFIIK
ncbi:hypothetical protein FSP39_013398 [Pinctada imbricata]|uniref:ERCC4 domain-containing protein n=1 Tax=Pinctada imbricata TaxID=66713 RepID=A0AA88XRU6_PINIB|nr:hypothetical protein FSP39_013398 [Pinctada imbricata]